MAAWLDGDARAFDDLFRRLSPRVVAFLRAMCRDQGLAEDLTQTTFLKVHRARATYQRGAPVEPWVLAIARRAFLDHRRSVRRRPEDLAPDGAVPEPPPPPPEAPQGFERLEDDKARALEQHLGALPPAQREALVLTKVQGLSIREAAAVAGTTVGAIKLRAHRAYEALRKVLDVKPGKKP